MKISRFFPPHIVFIFKIYLLGILTFTLFRILLFIVNYNHIYSIDEDRWYYIIMAFFMGLRFDTVISAYILSVPLLFLTLLQFIVPAHKTVRLGLFNWSRVYSTNFVIIYCGALYSLAFIICAIDIPYFTFFFSRLTTMALTWFDNPEFVIKMIFSEKTYWIYIIPMLAVLLGFLVILQFFRTHYLNVSHLPGRKYLSQQIDPAFPSPLRYYVKTSVFSVLMFGLLFAGIRGRLEKKSPIRVGTAFFSPYAFPNQLGLNPVFTFLRSSLDDLKSENQKISLIEDAKAIDLVGSSFGITDQLGSPVARIQKAFVRNTDDTVKTTSPNVIIVIMESMGANKMGRFGNADNLTPFLDKLADRGYSFDQAYTAGIHTYNGIFSTLFSHPAILNQHSLKRLPIQSYSGISQTLKSFGYQTIFFMTHDDQFDNTGGFLRANGFDEVISQKDYPASMLMSTLGVPDHYLFENSINRLSRMYLKGKPFLAAYMTASDHGPYIIPAGIPFKPKNTDIRKAIVEYADYSISHFLKLASLQPWFSNTYFVFVADHGFSEGGVYDMPLSYHHTPFIIYAPTLLREAKSFDKMAGQIDIFPTLMGLLNKPFVNNTLGINLLTESRPYIYFSDDDKIACLNAEYFYVYRKNGPHSLYRWKMNDTYNYLASYPKITTSMRNYAFQMIQTSQYMIDNQLVSLKTIKLPKNGSKR